MTRNGSSFERPTWERRTIVLARSSGLGDAVLPIPDAGHFEGKPETWQARRARAAESCENSNGFGLTIGQIASVFPTPDANSGDVTAMLPTPQAYEADHGGSQDPEKRRATGHQVYLSDVVEKSLPTPRATDGVNGGPNQRGSAGDLAMPSIAAQLPTPTAEAKRFATPRVGGGNDRYPAPSQISGEHGRDLGPDLVTAMSSSFSAILPTPAASDSSAGKTSRGNERSSELLLAGLTRAMLRIASSGASVTMTSRKRSGRGKQSPDGEHLTPLFPIDEATSG
jgi:hypothetical protein